MLAQSVVVVVAAAAAASYTPISITELLPPLLLSQILEGADKSHLLDLSLVIF